MSSAWYNPATWFRSLSMMTAKLSSPTIESIFPGVRRKFAGVTVTPETALQCSAWYRGITVLANSTAMMPLQLRKIADGSMVTHQASRVARRPDKSMPRFTWFQTLLGHVLTHGNAYAEIRRSANKTAVVALNLMDPTDIIPVWDGDKKVYTSRQNQSVRIAGEDVIHIPGFGYDGLRGIPAMEAARRSISLDLGAEEYGANWFGAGNRPSGVLTHPGELEAATVERMRDDWERIHAENSQRIAILQEGIKFDPYDNDPSKSQAIETRRWQVLTVARFLGVPPHMLFAAEGTPFATVSQLSREFLTFSLAPWMSVIEEEFTVKLLTDAEIELYEFNFDETFLLRADVETQHKIDVADINAGVRSIAEVRLDRGLPFVPGTDKHRVPLNFGTLRDDGTIDNNGMGNGNVPSPKPQGGQDGTQV